MLNYVIINVLIVTKYHQIVPLFIVCMENTTVNPVLYIKRGTKDCLFSDVLFVV